MQERRFYDGMEVSREASLFSLMTSVLLTHAAAYKHPSRLWSAFTIMVTSTTYS